MPKFLFVDDHAIVRTGLKRVIEDAIPHSIIDEAMDGDSALEKIKKNDYDLVVMDVNMPNTDSFGVLSTILAYKPALKIMMFSMNAEEIYAKRYMKMGAMGYLRKDSAGSEIKRAFEMVLDNKKYISSELSQMLLDVLHGDSGPDNPFDRLSARELEIVQHLIRGDSVGAISQKLHLHTSTIGTHKARIFNKLKCDNIIDLDKLAKLHNISV